MKKKVNLWNVLTNEEKQEILERYRDGDGSTNSLSEEYQIDKRFLTQFIKDNGVSINAGAKTYEHFILGSIKVHGVEYNYSQVEFKSWNDPVLIICNTCENEFLRTPRQHVMLKHGCLNCNDSTIDRSGKIIEKFEVRARKIHNESYDYSKSIFVAERKKITITCPHHGDFLQTPFSHLSGLGCPSCERISKNIAAFDASFKEFVRKSNLLYDGLYSYESSVYVSCDTPLEITCPLHGAFWKTPTEHLRGSRCKTCRYLLKTKSQETFIEEANLAHGFFYDYSTSCYSRGSDKINILCPDHGEFEVVATAHLLGTGCPNCSTKISLPERRIISLFERNNIDFVFQKRFEDCRNPETNCMLPFDFYISDLNLIIEYDGQQHFKPVEYWGGETALEATQVRDSIKNNYCRDRDIKLLRICYKEDVAEALLRENIIPLI